ncbi:MAG: hypothetical protein KGD72_11415 [Candidatus Lokiarchaeota archaeon]|nr:hypothetical protein [Candidatus Lokiarchaeota archaeon]
MEVKHRLKPHFFITPHRRDTSVYCPACGQIMEKILHTPKNRRPVYLCPSCNTITPKQVFTFLDFK